MKQAAPAQTETHSDQVHQRQSANTFESVESDGDQASFADHRESATAQRETMQMMESSPRNIAQRAAIGQIHNSPRMAAQRKAMSLIGHDAGNDTAQLAMGEE